MRGLRFLYIMDKKEGYKMSDIFKKYEKRVVCFLDILGFKNIVKYKSINDIKSIFDDINNFSTNIIKDAAILKNDDIQITHFSDSVVISYNVTSQDQLAFIIMNLQSMFIHLLQKEILLRGAITLGELFHSNDKLFGPALVEAYELESTISIYPRVIISRDVLWYENFSADREISSQQSIKISVCSDMDGWHYVDYVHVPQKFDSFIDYMGYISKSLDLISAHLDKDMKIKIKYAWLNKKVDQVLVYLNKNNLAVKDKKQFKTLQSKCKNNARKLYSKIELK